MACISDFVIGSYCFLLASFLKLSFYPTFFVKPFFVLLSVFRLQLHFLFAVLVRVWRFFLFTFRDFLDASRIVF